MKKCQLEDLRDEQQKYRQDLEKSNTDLMAINKKIVALKDFIAGVERNKGKTLAPAAELIILQRQRDDIALRVADTDAKFCVCEMKIAEIEQQQNEQAMDQLKEKKPDLLRKYALAAEPYAAVCREIDNWQMAARGLRGYVQLFGRSGLPAVPKFFSKIEECRFTNEEAFYFTPKI